MTTDVWEQRVRELRRLLVLAWRRHTSRGDGGFARGSRLIWCLVDYAHTYEEAAQLHVLFHELGWLRDDELTELGRAQVVQYDLEEGNRGR